LATDVIVFLPVPVPVLHEIVAAGDGVGALGLQPSPIVSVLQSLVVQQHVVTLLAVVLHLAPVDGLQS